MAPLSTETLAQLTLDENTDVVTWCPSARHRYLLVAGTYQLDAASGRRTGSLRAWQVTGGPGGSAEGEGGERGAGGDASPEGDASPGAAGPPPFALHELSRLDLGVGVFETCWEPARGPDDDAGGSRPPLLAAALTDGSVRVFETIGRRDPSEPTRANESAFRQLVTTDPAAGGALACAVDWCADDPSLLAASYSDGGLATWRVDGRGAGGSSGDRAGAGGAGGASVGTAAREDAAEGAHDLEAWAVAWGSAGSLWSGGDDAALRRWDPRAGLRHGPVATDRREHGAGVTCVAPAPAAVGEHVLATGCYDEHLRIWDDRAMRRPLASLRVQGGGVWRARWSPDGRPVLALACMHAGQRVVGVDGVDARGVDWHALGILADYPLQKTLAYGISWRPGGEGGRGRPLDGRRDPAPATVASCSFYDNSLHVWTVGS